MKYKSKDHERWHRIVEGQIRDCYNKHPEFFPADKGKRNSLQRSLAKRIVGEIIEASANKKKMPTNVAHGRNSVGKPSKPYGFVLLGFLRRKLKLF